MLFRFEDHVLDIARRELRHAGTLVPLEPQVFDLLVYVIRNRDRVVGKDDLVEAVWGGRAISDSTLTTRINAMRKALGDSGEEQRLAQVLRNLIDNAVSFSPEGGVVCVTVSAADGRVLLRVEDDGPGVPPENREDIFNRFYSERPPGEDFGRHSGLGLAIARAIVDAHDGKIRVSDRNPGSNPPGARFTVSLPAAA